MPALIDSGQAMIMRETALNYLMRDYLLHVDMIECIRRDICRIAYAGENGVLLQVDGGTGAMLSCESTELALSLPKIGEYALLVLHQTAHRENFCRRFGYQAGKECWQGAYTKSMPLEEQSADIRRLDMRFLDTVTEVYGMHDREYMRYLIEEGVMFGVFDGGQLAGFIGRHAEGSIGLLEILPEFRRRGYAEALERRYVNMELEKGHVPYGQVYVGNQISRHLQEKLGMEFSDGHLCWLWRD